MANKCHGIFLVCCIPSLHRAVWSKLRDFHSILPYFWFYIQIIIVLSSTPIFSLARCSLNAEDFTTTMFANKVVPEKMFSSGSFMRYLRGRFRPVHFLVLTLLCILCTWILSSVWIIEERSSDVAESTVLLDFTSRIYTNFYQYLKIEILHGRSLF